MFSLEELIKTSDIKKLEKLVKELNVEDNVLFKGYLKDVNEEMQYIANQCGRMSHIISRFKSFITKYAKDNDIPFKWQTRFYDRIIRDYADYIVTEHYINNNISKWKDDDF